MSIVTLPATVNVIKRQVLSVFSERMQV